MKKVLNVTFSKSGSGSQTTRLSLPITWLREMGVTEEDRAVEVEFDGEKIIIKCEGSN